MTIGGRVRSLAPLTPREEPAMLTTTTDATADARKAHAALIRDLRTVADELEAAAAGAPAAKLDSTVAEVLTWDAGAFTFRISRDLRCGNCGRVQLGATVNTDGECPECAALPRD